MVTPFSTVYSKNWRSVKFSCRPFALPGVESLLITPEFVTVSKHVATNWEQLEESVERVLEKWLEGT